ncbi:hypothetical protein HDV64DRAFT_271489 [Trichoderma sp. TUCIM 5745]
MPLRHNLLTSASRVVSVHDPNNLSEQFIQRLRDRTRPSDKTLSRPADLAQVSERILQIAIENEMARIRAFQPHSESPDLPSPEEQRIEDLEKERKCHAMLVADGGRPFYPIHLLDAVSKNPTQYRELLLFWQGDYNHDPERWSVVFGNQLFAWEEFRGWQGRMRERYKDNFSQLTEGVKREVARLSVTQPFELDPDPKRQDKLTEWIEYMSFEYIMHRRYKWTKNHEAWYRKGWQKLVDSQVLRPSDTIEYVTSNECESERRRELPQAEQAVEYAKSMVLLAQQAVAEPSHHPSSHAQQRLAAAQSELDEATRLLTSVERRNKLIMKFNRTAYNYRKAKNVIERYGIFFQWLRDQLPLIEQEMKQTGAAESSVGNGESSGVERDREHQSGEEDDGTKRKGEEDSTKRQKSEGEEPLSTIATATAIGHGVQNFGCSREASTDDGPPSKRPKLDAHGSVIQGVPRTDDGETAAQDARTAAAPCMKEDENHDLERPRSIGKRRRDEQAEPARVSKRHRGEDVADDQLRKRPRSEVLGTSPEKKVSSGDAPSVGGLQRLSDPAAKTLKGHDKTASIPRQLRRSARIAARLDAAKNTSAPPRAAKHSGPRSRAQAPTPPSPTGSQTGRSNLLTAKAATGRATRRGGRLEASKPTGVQKSRRC